MWVRSQDKMILRDCKDLEISLVEEPYIVFSNMEKKQKEHLGQWQIKECATVVAYYSTKEKALKVLDLLQKYVGGKSDYYISQDRGNPDGYFVSNDINIPIFYCKDGVFQMPQDNEV